MMHHQAALLPAFQLQSAMQDKICGAAFWQEQTAKRAALSSELYVSIASMMDPVRGRFFLLVTALICIYEMLLCRQGKMGLNSTKDASTKAVSVKKDASPPSWKEKVSASKVSGFFTTNLHP